MREAVALTLVRDTPDLAAAMRRQLPDVLVVDNGSREAIADAWLRLEENVYFSGGWNRALEHLAKMRPEVAWAWLLNSDVSWASDTMLRELVAAAVANRLVMVSPRVPSSPYAAMHAAGYRETAYVDMVAPLVHVGWYLAAGGLDEALKGWGADIDLCYRTRGDKKAVLGTLVLAHPCETTSKRLGDTAMHHLLDSREYLLRKHGPGVREILPAYFLVEPAAEQLARHTPHAVASGTRSVPDTMAEGGERQKIVLGIGTGQCGLERLAAAVNRQPEAQSAYEEAPWLEWREPGAGSREHGAGSEGDAETPTRFAGTPHGDGESTPAQDLRPKTQVLIARFARFRKNAKPGKVLLGDCASFYLPYLEAVIALEPDVRIVCLKRPREEVVAGFCQWLDQSTPLPMNHWARQPAPGWHHDPNRTRIYPQYDTPVREEGIRLYWEEYYQRAEEVARQYPANVRVFDAAEALGTEAGLREVLGWLGVGTEGIRDWGLGTGGKENKDERSRMKDEGVKDERAGPPSPLLPSSLSPVLPLDPLPAGRALTLPSPGGRGDLCPIPNPFASPVPSPPRPRRAFSDPMDRRRCAVLVPFATAITPPCERALVEAVWPSRGGLCPRSLAVSGTGAARALRARLKRCPRRLGQRPFTSSGLRPGALRPASRPGIAGKRGWHPCHPADFFSRAIPGPAASGTSHAQSPERGNTGHPVPKKAGRIHAARPAAVPASIRRGAHTHRRPYERPSAAEPTHTGGRTSVHPPWSSHTHTQAAVRASPAGPPRPPQRAQLVTARRQQLAQPPEHIGIEQAVQVCHGQPVPALGGRAGRDAREPPAITAVPLRALGDVGSDRAGGAHQLPARGVAVELPPLLHTVVGGAVELQRQAVGGEPREIRHRTAPPA